MTLFKAGLSKTVILASIRNSNSNFDTSPDAIIDLKKQGLPDDVIEVMINKPAESASSVLSSPNQSNPGLAGSSLNLIEPDIYYVDDSTNKQIQLDGSVFSQAKTGSGILTAVTYGVAKTRSKAVLSGTQANFRVSNANPVFYFVFPQSSGNFGSEANAAGWYSDATSPNELLVKFKVAKKGREVITGSYGTYSGFSGGIDDDNKIAFRFTKISPGVYKVYLENPLKDGEYAFMFGGTATMSRGVTASQKAFDFSMISGK